MIRIKRILPFCLAVTMAGAGIAAHRMTVRAETSACSVNGREYATLAEGISAWTEGSTLTLLSDCATSTVSVRGEKTLDLNGYTLRGDGNGSVLRVERDALFTVLDSGEDGTITGGNAQLGGGICVTGGDLFLEGGSVSGNTAAHGGGICLTDGSRLVISGGTVEENVSAEYGGGIAVYASTVSMTSGSVSNNSANNNGGGLYLYGDGSLTYFFMSGGEISGNAAGVNGGGVSVWDNACFVMEGGEICGNTAENYGGGIYIHGERAPGYRSIAELYATAAVTGNSASYGGGVYVDEMGLLSCRGYPPPDSADDGDGVGQTGGEAEICVLVYIEENECAYAGGGVYLSEDGKAEFIKTVYVQSNVGPDGTDNNLYVAGEETLSLSDDFDGLLCLSVPKSIVLVSDYTGNANVFVSDSADYRIRMEGDDLVAANVVVLSLSITAMPEKRSYTEGEIFDPAGMEVTVTYADGSERVTQDYAVAGGTLATGTNEVQISYTEEGRTVTASVPVSVASGGIGPVDPAPYEEEDGFSPVFVASISCSSLCVIAVVLVGFFMNKKKRAK